MMSPQDELVLDVRAWLDTWAPNCGAPRAVFEGQFKVLMEHLLFDAVNDHDIEQVREIIRRACR